MSKKNKELKGKKIIIQLLNGIKLKGTIVDWTDKCIWILDEKDSYKKDVPKDIIKRAFVLLKE